MECFFDGWQMKVACLFFCGVGVENVAFVLMHHVVVSECATVLASARILYTSPETANKYMLFVSEMLTQRYRAPLFGGKIFFQCEIVSTLEFRAQWPLLYIYFSPTKKTSTLDSGLQCALGEAKKKCDQTEFD